MFKVPEQHRIKHGSMGSDSSYENNGAFGVPIKYKTSRRIFSVIAADGEGFEHVSVSLPDRCPTWSEMCVIKSLFWGANDCVMQLHPPEDDYINNHPFCLHLWRPIGVEIPRPHHKLVGVKS